MPPIHLEYKTPLNLLMRVHNRPTLFVFTWGLYNGTPSLMMKRHYWHKFDSLREVKQQLTEWFHLHEEACPMYLEKLKLFLMPIKQGDRTLPPQEDFVVDQFIKTQNLIREKNVGEVVYAERFLHGKGYWRRISNWIRPHYDPSILKFINTRFYDTYTSPEIRRGAVLNMLNNNAMLQMLVKNE